MALDEYWTQGLPNNRTGNKCRNCFFGVETESGTKCECHINRPVSSGKFPPVRPNDYCGYWTDPETLTRPFAQLAAEPPPLVAVPVAAPAPAPAAAKPEAKPGKKPRKE